MKSRSVVLRIILFYCVCDYLAGYAGFLPGSLGSAASGQQQPANPINTQQITLPVFTLNPTPVPYASVQLTGNPGPQVYYYWIVANYPIGSAQAGGPFTMSAAPNTLSASNFVTILPVIPAGSTTYDVLRTTSPFPPSGACNCAVATAVSPSSSTTDQSNSLNAYTVNPANLPILGMTVQNEVQSTGVSHLILRQNGAFVADLSLAGVSGVTSVFGRAGPAVAAQAGDYTWDLIGAGSNLQSQSMGNGGIFKPVNFGNIFSTGMWMHVTDPQPSTGPTWTSNNSAGTLNNGHTYGVEFTLCASGLSPCETTPSAEVQHQLATVGCASGSCQIVVTPPTIPIGFSGFTVYARDFTASQSMQQIAGCVNVATCTFGSIPTTSAPPTNNATMPLPPNYLAGNLPPNTTPNWTLPDSNGNQRPQAYISQFCDNTNGPPCPAVTFTEVGRHAWSDQQQDPPAGKNAMLTIDHSANGVLTALTNQDRTIWCGESNAVGDTAQHYSFECLQTEVDINGHPTWNAAVDAEIAPVSAQLSMQTDSSYSAGTPNGGVQVFRAGWFRKDSGVGVGEATGFLANMAHGGTGTPAAGTVENGFKWAPTSGGVTTNITSVGYRMQLPARFGAGVFGIYATGGLNPTACSVSGCTDYFIRNDVHGWFADLNTTLGSIGIQNTDLGLYPISAASNQTGSISTTQIATSWNPGASAVCSGGAVTYTYQLVAVDGNGGRTPSTNFGCTTGVNPLTSGNPATINLGGNTPYNTVFAQAKQIDVERIAGPMGLGKVGTLSCSTEMLVFGCSAFVDNGLTATGTVTGAGSNTSGGANVAGYLHSGTNTVQLGSDFTSAANTTLQTIGTLFWNLDGNAKKYSFHCSLMYSQATAAVSMQFGIQAATIAPNDISAKGRVDISSSTQTSGVLSNLASITATSIVTFTPSASGTVFGADLDGSIDQPVNNAGQVVNIMVQTSNSADLPTVKRGSYCQLY